MKRILTILSLCILCCTLPAQTNKQGGRPRAAQTQQATKKKQQTTRKAKATPQKQGAGKKRGTQQKQQKQCTERGTQPVFSHTVPPRTAHR